MHTSDLMTNAGRIIQGLIGGPAAVGYVRQSHVLQGAAPQIEINFDLLMEHSIAAVFELERRINERIEKEIKAEVPVFKGAPTDACQHGVPWNDNCVDCSNLFEELRRVHQ
jgi:hypothetical protein